jgi:hypothetical protein
VAAHRLGGVKGGEGVHGGVLLGVELLGGGAAQDVGGALVEAEADLAVDALLGEVETGWEGLVWSLLDGKGVGGSRCRKARSGEK